ncbi:MAG TPA: metalloregulator ArsR/SmtB family transcription factor [Caulobacterales bacterium]|jgi:DNA-binding transcriptional ArsR family regulator|nr:metalloregulator ArsR/SmtB family transcription factor [Caulobacterales bacterium]
MPAFAALAEPTRQRIVELLAKRERSAGEIAKACKASPPAISQHLKVLREAKLVRVRAEAQRRIYALAPEGVAELDEWIGRIKRFWSPRLDALEAALGKEKR